MFANFVIGLREGLEAALIIGILVAYLVRSDRHDLLRWVWLGVGLAVGLSVGIWGVVTATASELSERGEEIFAGVLSIVAVCFVTWMILWMRSAARNMRADLGGKLEAAMVAGPMAVALTSFLAVAREGVETVLFLWSSMRATGGGALPTLGAAVGLAAAIVLGYLIYRGALSLNLATFFTWTGLALIAIAAWVLSYGVHELAEAGVIPELEWLTPVVIVAYAGLMSWLFFRGPDDHRPTPRGHPA